MPPGGMMVLRTVPLALTQALVSVSTAAVTASSASSRDSVDINRLVLPIGSRSLMWRTHTSP